MRLGAIISDAAARAFACITPSNATKSAAIKISIIALAIIGVLAAALGSAAYLGALPGITAAIVNTITPTVGFIIMLAGGGTFLLAVALTAVRLSQLTKVE